MRGRLTLFCALRIRVASVRARPADPRCDDGVGGREKKRNPLANQARDLLFNPYPGPFWRLQHVSLYYVPCTPLQTPRGLPSLRISG